LMLGRVEDYGPIVAPLIDGLDIPPMVTRRCVQSGERR